LKMQVYHELEILNIECNCLNVISSIIENNGGRLKKILFRPYETLEFEDYNFYEDSLSFIHKTYENCPSVEYLSIAISPSKDHFIEFEKLLKTCQNLKSLSITIYNMDEIETNEKILENGNTLLEILIRSAPINLKEIGFDNGDFKFSLENFEEFLGKWKGRSALSIFTPNSTYEEENYKKLINKYKRDGVIKDYTYGLRDHFNHNDDV
jgi:hypothetical protein